MGRVCLQCKKCGLIPGSGRSPEGGNGNSLQYSCWDNSMDRGVWQATIHRIAESRNDWSNWAHTNTHAHTTKHWEALKCPINIMWIFLFLFHGYLSTNSILGKYKLISSFMENYWLFLLIDWSPLYHTRFGMHLY